MEKQILPFRLRGLEAQVEVRFGINDDPERWGYHLLGVDFDIDLARGFPVVEARVSYPGEGYAAYLAWIQVVRYWVSGRSDPTVVAADVAPQMKEFGVPYLSWGREPTLFDAPAFDEKEVVWRAWSFLTHTPDLVMTPAVEPVCGFAWGYDVRDGKPEATPVTPAGHDQWLDIRAELRPRYPGWTFGGETWRPTYEHAREGDALD